VLWIPLRTPEVLFDMISVYYSRLARASVENGKLGMTPDIPEYGIDKVKNAKK
jgi:hypothetical protein